MNCCKCKHGMSCTYMRYYCFELGRYIAYTEEDAPCTKFAVKQLGGENAINTGDRENGLDR